MCFPESPISCSNKWSNPTRESQETQFIASPSKVQVTTWDLWWASEVVQGQSCGTEPSALQEDSVRTELNCGTLSWRPEQWLVVWETPSPPYWNWWPEALPHNRILFSLKQEGNSDAGYNTNASLRHAAEWNKPATGGQVLLVHEFTYTRHLEESDS